MEIVVQKNEWKFMFFSAVSFQLAWWSGIFLGNMSLLLSLLLLLTHFYYSPQRELDFNNMVKVGGMGLVLNLLMTWTGLLNFDNTPVWLGLLWLHFGACFHGGFRFLQGLPRKELAIIGGVMGPLCYLAAMNFTQVPLAQSFGQTLVLMVIYWAVLLPSLVHFTKVQPTAPLAQQAQASQA